VTGQTKDGTVSTVPDELKRHFGAEYLYNVLPGDVVGDTLGVLFGGRRDLEKFRASFRREAAPDWKALVEGGTSESVVDQLRELVLARLTLSRTRAREPITLLPLAIGLVGDPRRKSVANAYRAVGSVAAQFFTPESARNLRDAVLRWEAQPLARLGLAVVSHFSGDRTTALDPTAPPVEPRDQANDVAREDVAALLHAWKIGGFGPQQQFEQLRALLCFHLVLYLVHRAATPLAHRGEVHRLPVFFLCDASQSVGSTFSRLAVSSFAFWRRRLEATTRELCYRSAASVRRSLGSSWDSAFAQLGTASASDRSREAENYAVLIAGRAIRETRRADRQLKELRDLLSEQLEGLAGVPKAAERAEAQLAEALFATYSSGSRVLKKVFDFLSSVGDGAGFVGPKGGNRKKRFLLRADLLDVLAVVHASRVDRGLVRDEDPLAVPSLLSEWFQRYRVVVDASSRTVMDAWGTGWIDEGLSLPDSAVSADNLRELEDRLIELRLARRYSDASVTLDRGLLQGA
jgi:hypothetical protein